MIFSKEKITMAFTVEKCNKCKKEIKRKFSNGDYLFKDASKCTSCDGQMRIEKIFGEPMEPE